MYDSWWICNNYILHWYIHIYIYTYTYIYYMCVYCSSSPSFTTFILGGMLRWITGKVSTQPPFLHFRNLLFQSLDTILGDFFGAFGLSVWPQPTAKPSASQCWKGIPLRGGHVNVTNGYIFGTWETNKNVIHSKGRYPKNRKGRRPCISCWLQDLQWSPQGWVGRTHHPGWCVLFWRLVILWAFKGDGNLWKQRL